jgi:hypothetical protein
MDTARLPLLLLWMLLMACCSRPPLLAGSNRRASAVQYRGGVSCAIQGWGRWWMQGGIRCRHISPCNCNSTPLDSWLLVIKCILTTLILINL